MSPLPAAPLHLLRTVSLLLLALLGGARGLHGQTLPQLGNQSTPEASTETAPGPAERLATVTAELEAARARRDNASSTASESLGDELALLERIEGVLRQQVATEELIKAEREVGRDLAKQLEFLLRDGPNYEEPYGFLLLDMLRDRHGDEQQRLERLRETVNLALAARADTREDLGLKQTARRQAREAVESQAKPSASSRRTVRRAELEEQLASEQLALRTLELERDQAQLANQDLRVQMAEAELEVVGPRAKVTQEDRELIQTDLAVRRMRASSDLEVARRSMEYATERWINARERNDAAGGNDPLLQAEVEAAAAEQTRRQMEFESIEHRLAGLVRLQELYGRRLEVFAGEAETEVVRAWCDEAEQELTDLAARKKLTIDQMSDARASLVTLDSQIETATDVSMVRWLRQRRTAKEALVDVYEKRLAFLEEQQRMNRKLISDAGLSSGGLDVFSFLSAVWDKIIWLWNREVFHVGENSITIRKIALGLTILVLGGFLAKRLSNFLCARILPNFGLNEGVRHAIESLLFYLLVITFALIALRVVNIPLTAFTILGGALAIGVGFGSQNIVNNFISGLILLTEQPVRVADLIQIGELYGTVQHIGLRSTRIRTGHNVELIVPNSSFLEQNVVNWTLNDTRTRIHVNVGVAYGSPTRKVKDLLKRAAAEHGLVLEKPEPLVLFANFGESSLDFEVHFWIHMKKLMDRRQLESDIRFRIDHLCRDAGITIAFPQRDVHLDADGPLEVRIVEADPDEDEVEAEPPPPVIP